MTTHYEALVRDARDAWDISANLPDFDDDNGAVMRAHRRAYVLEKVLAYATEVEIKAVENRRIEWSPVLKGLIGQCIFIDVEWSRYRSGGGHHIVSWRMADIDETDFPMSEDTSTWSKAVMTPDDFAGFVTSLTAR